MRLVFLIPTTNPATATVFIMSTSTTIKVAHVRSEIDEVEEMVGKMRRRLEKNKK
jgi:hypothetical protein